jgi:hypothetical protein
VTTARDPAAAKAPAATVLQVAARCGGADGLGSAGRQHDDELRSLIEGRLGPAVAASFTAEQIAAVKMLFGARNRGLHAVDCRRSIRIGRTAFYVVFLAGRERRSPARLAAEGRSRRSLGSSAAAVRALLLALMLGGAALLLLRAM